MNRNVTANELLTILGKYSVVMRDSKGKEQYFILSPALYNNIAWGLHYLKLKEKQHNKQTKGRKDGEQE